MSLRDDIAGIIRGNGPYGEYGHEHNLTQEEALDCADDILAHLQHLLEVSE